MTIGEMPKELREAILSQARARWIARRDQAPRVVEAVDELIQKAVSE